MAEQPDRCTYQYPYYLDYLEHAPCPEPPWEANGCCFFHSENPTKSAQDMMQRVREKLARGDKDFAGYVFPAWCDFGGIDFGDYARFDYATFGDYASFISATFGDRASFENATFHDGAIFWRANFGHYACFEGATFGNRASFIIAVFGDYASFDDTTFGDEASFSYARFSDDPFRQRGRFAHANFGDGADFRIANPSGRFILQDVTFQGRADFSGTSQDLSYFEFHNVALPRAIFRGAIGLDKVEFDAVRWGSRPGRAGCVVGDEEEARESGEAADYEAAERVYREIRRSYIVRKDFTMARLMHYGEMEMRRLKETAQRRENHQWLGRRWLRWLSHVSLTGAYKVVSGYGTRWLNAFVTLLILWEVFALIFAVAGLDFGQGSIPPMWVSSDWFNLFDWLNRLGHGAIQSALSLLLRPAEYARPASGLGWVAAFLAMMLGPVVITTLVFAVREQFRSL